MSSVYKEATLELPLPEFDESIASHNEKSTSQFSIKSTVIIVDISEDSYYQDLMKKEQVCLI